MSTPLQRSASRRELAARFREILLTAAGSRRTRDRLLATEDGAECEWVIYERETMHSAVNAERALRNLPPVDVMEVRRVERLAMGHSDYVAQFAWHCSGLVLGEL